MSTEFVDEWRAADRAASMAEREVADAWSAAFARGARPPHQDDIDHAKRMRGIASDLFAVAMQTMAERAQKLSP